MRVRARFDYQAKKLHCLTTTTSPNGPSRKNPSKAKPEEEGPPARRRAAWGGSEPRPRGARRRGAALGQAPDPPSTAGLPTPSHPSPRLPGSGPGSPPPAPGSPTPGPWLGSAPHCPHPLLPGPAPRPAPGPGSRQTPTDSGRHSQLLVEPGLAAGLEVTDNDTELPDVLHELLQVLLQVVELLRHGPAANTPPRVVPLCRFLLPPGPAATSVSFGGRRRGQGQAGAGSRRWAGWAFGGAVRTLDKRAGAGLELKAGPGWGGAGWGERQLGPAQQP